MVVKVGVAPLAHIDHSGCLGSCPVYAIDVWDDGRVDYDGGANVKVLGHATSQISEPELVRLRSAFEEAHFMSVDDKRYAMMDTPTTILAYRSSAGVHSVQMLAQPGIARLEAELEKIVGAIRWVGTDDERPHHPSPALAGVLSSADAPGVLEEAARGAATADAKKRKKR